jgi:P4 family phage/plasmid primase-like protien
MLQQYRVEAGRGIKGSHNGMDDMRGVFNVPNYSTDPQVREDFFGIIEDIHRRRKPYVLMENICGLPADAETRLRFDIDVQLPYDGDHPLALNLAVAHNFCATLWQVLHECTNISGASRFFIDAKGAPTPAGAGMWKHGIKIVCADIKCTHKDMLGIRQLLNERYSEWGHEEWLSGKEAQETQIIDDCIYKNNGTMLHGAVKAKQQQHGGYNTVKVMGGDDLHYFSDGDLHDFSFGELLRLKSILHHDEDTAKLEWQEGEEPVLLSRRGTKRSSSGNAVRAAAHAHYTNRLTTAEVQHIYEEAGGALQLQEIAGAQAGTMSWREVSPGTDARVCLVPDCNGAGHSDNALLIEGYSGLRYRCCSTGKSTYLTNWPSDDELLFGGDVGLAMLYAKLRGHDVKNIGGDGEKARFIVYCDKSALWKPRYNSYIRGREIPTLVTVYIDPVLDEWMPLLHKAREAAAARKEANEVDLEKDAELEELNNKVRPYTALKTELAKSSKRDAILKDIFTYVRDMEFEALLDVNKDIFSCRNGIIDLPTATLRARTREDMQTRAVNIDYNPNSPRIPEVMQILSDITLAAPDRLNRPALLERLLRLLGYTITGHVREEIIIFLLGRSARNGKGIIESLLQKILGHMFYQAPTTFLTAVKAVSAGSAAPHMMALRGARGLHLDELPAGVALDVQMIKNLTGGADISGRNLFEGQTSFSPTAVPWANTNEMPIIKAEPAILQRIEIIPCDAKFRTPGDAVFPYDPNDKTHFKKDPKLRDNLPVEAFLAVVVEGAKRWYESGLGEKPECCKLVCREFAADNDTLQNWIENECELTPRAGEDDALVACSSALIAYNIYRQAQVPPLPVIKRRELHDQMAAKGFQKQDDYRKQGSPYNLKNVYVGLRLSYE